MTGNRLSEIARAMGNADFYPHPAPGIERRETHISLVFLAGAFVYKIKKPVALAFLDFSTLEKRRRACDAEIRLNRRLSTKVYDRVVPIAESDGGLLLDGPGQPVEYAVKMRRLDDRHTMVRLLGENALNPSNFRQLAEKLAAFYREAQISRRIGGPETVRENCEENFRQMAPFVGRLISPPRFTLIRTATDGFLQRRQSLFQKRVEAGGVREGHGDLRAARGDPRFPSSESGHHPARCLADSGNSDGLSSEGLLAGAGGRCGLQSDEFRLVDNPLEPGQSKPRTPCPGWDDKRLRFYVAELTE